MRTATCARVLGRYPLLDPMEAPSGGELAAHLASALRSAGFAAGDPIVGHLWHAIPVKINDVSFEVCVNRGMKDLGPADELEVNLWPGKKPFLPAWNRRPRRDAEVALARAVDAILNQDPNVSGVLWYKDHEQASDEGRSWRTPDFSGEAQPPESAIQRYFREIEEPVSALDDRLRTIGFSLFPLGALLLLLNALIGSQGTLKRIGMGLLLAGFAFGILSWCLGFAAAFVYNAVEAIDGGRPVRSRISALILVLILAGFASLMLRGCKSSGSARPDAAKARASAR